jgi:predicted deacylase
MTDAHWAVDTVALDRLPSGRHLRTYRHRIMGGEGPHVVIVATQHGIELAGAVVIRHLIDELDTTAVAGQLTLIPVMNPLAFDHRSYMTPGDYDVLNPNLNRSWPGDAEGTLVERMCAAYWRLLEQADVVVDLHTGTPSMSPHARVASDRKALRLAGTTGWPAITVTDTGTAGAQTLRDAASTAGITAITLELGDSRSLAPEMVRAGTDAVAAIVSACLTDASGGRGAEPPLHWIDAGDAVRASTAGLFEPATGCQVGEQVSAGTVLGNIFDPMRMEALEELVAPASGLLYSRSVGGAIVAGERVASIAVAAETA